MTTREFNRLIKKLEEYKKELRHKISFNQGQLEFADDMIKQLEDSKKSADAEEKERLRREEDQKKLKGVKTPRKENI